MTPMARSRAKWRKAGFFVDSAESIIRVPGSFSRRNDLFGFCDLVAVGPGGVVLIQTTSASNMAARVRKLRTEHTGTGTFATPIREIARCFLDAGVRIVVEGWRQDRATRRWVCRERWITEADLRA